MVAARARATQNRAEAPRKVAAAGLRSASGPGWWVSKWVACRRQWSRSPRKSSRSARRSSAVCSRCRTSRSRCRIFSSKSSVLEGFGGVSSRSASVFWGYTLCSSAGSICHWFFSSRVALNRPFLMASRMVDFCFPVALAACPRVYGKGSASFSWWVLPTVRPSGVLVKDSHHRQSVEPV